MHFHLYLRILCCESNDFVFKRISLIHLFLAKGNAPFLHVQTEWNVVDLFAINISFEIELNCIELYFWLHRRFIVQAQKSFQAMRNLGQSIIFRNLIAFSDISM